MRTASFFCALSVSLCASFAVVSALAAGPATTARVASPPAVGDKAKDFELTNLAGEKIKLSALTKTGPVVLVVLRGFPGYQCPVCTELTAQFLARAREFREARASVVLVYPGPATGLKQHAADFATGKDLPESFHLLLDPDYEMTNAYRLRWNAKRETAYPSTFVIDAERKVRFAKVSKSHGDRARVDDVLKALSPLE